MRKSTVYGIITVALSVFLTTMGLELAFRIHHEKVFQFKSLTAEPLKQGKRMTYHPLLGWIPSPGRYGIDWTSNVDASGLRSNGRSISSTSRPVLTVGDSFTFGDEVEDSETWAAHLEKVLNRRVLNAGVGAYGIDQAVLRAELLLDEYNPDVVILAFISDDINRTELSYYPFSRGWKPYFELANGSLIPRNVPVPDNLAPRRFQSLRGILGYSLLANAVLRRTAQRWWQDRPAIGRVHNHGETVSVELIARLDSVAKTRGGQFIAVALATNGRIGTNVRLPNVIRRAREKGIKVLDLSTETLKLPADQLQNLFRPGGHYAPSMNHWVADRIAAFLYEGGMPRPAN